MTEKRVTEGHKINRCEHLGHRTRLKRKFIEGGADALASHELLELLLFYCVPRRNTNDIAHKMIDELGSLEKVLTADERALCEFDYISENGAILIKLVKELERRCAMESTGAVSRYDSIDKVGRFLLSLYTGQTVEKLYLLMFDSSMRMLDCVCVCEGGVSSVKLCSRKIMESILYSKAANVILAHNHPGGLAVPSKNDLALTRQLENLIECLDARLLAHIIVANGKYMPINNSGDGKFDITI